MELLDAHLTTRLKSPVTSADLESQATIEEGCSRLSPAIPMISDERASALKLRLSVNPICFVFDPLDGTKEFIAERSEFAVNVTLIENDIPTAGIIFAPAINKLHFAAGTRVAFVGDDCDRHRSLCDTTVDGRSRPITLASRSHLDEETAALISECQPCALRRLGSSLKFALIAVREANLYPRLSPTMAWDRAAGQTLVEATGGVVLRPNGSPLIYKAGLRNEGFFAARTKTFAEKALAIIDARRLPSRHHRTLQNNTSLGE